MTLFGKVWWFRSEGHGVGGGTEDKAKSFSNVHKGLEKLATATGFQNKIQCAGCSPNTRS